MSQFRDVPNLNPGILNQQVTRLQHQLADKEAEIKKWQEQASENQRHAETIQTQNEKVLRDKEQEIARLNRVVDEAVKKGKPDNALLQELVELRTQNQVLNTKLQAELHANIERYHDLELLRPELNATKFQLEHLRKLTEQLQTEKLDLENQLTRLDQQTQAAFQPQDMSAYFTEAINQFNKAVNTENAAVNYIINGMDVDMKAYVAKTEDNRMLLAAPSLTSSGEQALSSIRFSISAVPKNMASDE